MRSALPACPKCSSRSVMQVGSAAVDLVCTNCGHRWALRDGPFEQLKRELAELEVKLREAVLERDALRAKLAMTNSLAIDAAVAATYAVVESDLRQWVHPKTATLMVQFNARTGEWRVWGRNTTHEGSSSLADAYRVARDNARGE